MDDCCVRNHEEAFDNAIAQGMTEPWDYMYMYSDSEFDYFKHRVTREFVQYPYTEVESQDFDVDSEMEYLL